MFAISILEGCLWFQCCMVKLGKMWVVYTEITLYLMVFSYFFNKTYKVFGHARKWLNSKIFWPIDLCLAKKAKSIPPMSNNFIDVLLINFWQYFEIEKLSKSKVNIILKEMFIWLKIVDLKARKKMAASMKRDFETLSWPTKKPEINEDKISTKKVFN
jgi:hypothetical protein